MSNSKRALVALFALSLCTVVPRAWADTAATPASPAEEVVKLWPGQPPGTEDWSKPEKATDMHVPDAGRVVHVINNVTQPTLTIVRPAAGRATGAGVVVLPGGGFGALAWDLEGTEVARWLADRGITAFVLKYRVHDQDPSMMPQIAKVLANPSTEVRFEEFMKLLEPRRQIAVADAVQAVRLVRANAAEYGVSASRIGMMGFSAGAMTTMSAVLEGDAAARPDFAAPIYGAMPAGRTPPKDGPPVFIAVAADDGTVAASKSIDIFEAWRGAGLPAELHVYETGGHGFGLGKPGTASAKWTETFEAWLTGHGAARGETL